MEPSSSHLPRYRKVAKPGRRPGLFRWPVFALLAALPGLAQSVAPNAVQAPGRRDLTDASLEDLMTVEVTTVSKKQQKLSRAAAAVYVISQEDIRRSGATNIPDVLRMAPGVNVSQINAGTWAISVRGFADRFTGKVLVLIDGRSVYDPTSSGVYWDQQHVPLEDIERIEVVRGPGGAVWGANAVNGVINIITKDSRTTHGGMMSAGSGSSTLGRGLVQFGGQAGERGSYRVFGDSFQIRDSAAPGGGRGADAWNLVHGGFRSDWNLSSRDTLLVEGDLTRTDGGETITTLFSNALPIQKTINDEVSVRAADLLARWNHILENGSEITVQAYYDRFNRAVAGARNRLSTFDVDFQHHLKVGDRHDIVWGASHRSTKDSFERGYAVDLQPIFPTDHLFSTFFRDEIKLTTSLALSLGTKLEHNSYTGFEYEPSTQLVWTVTDRHAFWASASRAVRQPARFDTALSLDHSTVPLENGGFGVVNIRGTKDPKAETLLDYEIGYRAQVNHRLSVDGVSFLSYYKRLQTGEPGTAYFAAEPAPPHLVFPVVIDHLAHASSFGGELFANWNVTSHWKISPGVSLTHVRVVPEYPSQDTNAIALGYNTPKYQFQVRSFLNLPHNLEWDTSISTVARLRDGGTGPTPGYGRLDTRFGWRWGESVEFSVVGQNLLQSNRAEFHDVEPLNHSLVERSVYGKVTWRF